MFISEPTDIAQVIQLAIAPVFLLSGVAPILIVLTNRMARIIDRYRVLADEKRNLKNSKLYSAIEVEMKLLDRRSKYIHLAIASCTACALFICVVIGTLFLGSMFKLKFSILIAGLFVLAMLFLIVGLLMFLREIHIASRSIHSVAIVSGE